MKIVALSEVNGGPWSSAAEFDLKACYNTSRVETKDFEFLNAYPIPTSGPLKVSLPSIGRCQYAIYSIDGKYLKGSSSNSNTDYIELDLSNYEDGVYVIEVISNNNRKYLIKSIKK